MPTQIDAAGVYVGLTGEEIGCGEYVIHFPQKALLDSGVVVSAPQRGKHHHEPGLAEGTGGLIVVRRRFPPHLADAVTVATGDPNDGRVFLAIFGVRGQVGGQLARSGIITDGAKHGRGRIRHRLLGGFATEQFGLEAFPRLLQRNGFTCLDRAVSG
jgi:hypothetical protein